MQIRQSCQAALKDLLLSKPALVTKVAFTEALDAALEMLESMNTAAKSTASVANDIALEVSDKVKNLWEF